MEYGESLKEHRVSRGKTLKELAKETGLSFQNLSRWERNEVTPSVESCAILAQYYDITIDELIGLKN